jgi:hypothetical protein
LKTTCRVSRCNSAKHGKCCGNSRCREVVILGERQLRNMYERLGLPKA